MKQKTTDELTAIYFGDDTTDEDAFKVMKETGIGIGVSVHEQKEKETHAVYNLRSPHEVILFLKKMMECINSKAVRALVR